MTWHKDADVRVREVEEVETRTGKTRYVLRDDEGREFTTFRPQIGRDAARYLVAHALSEKAVDGLTLIHI